MQALSALVNVGECNQSWVTPEQESIEKLASAHKMSVGEMTALWRGAGAIPPVYNEKLSRLLSAETVNIVGKLRALKERRISAVIEGAYTSTHIDFIAKGRWSMEFALGKIKDDKLKRFVEKYDPDEHGGAVILGPTGLGKTIAVFCAMLRCKEKHARADIERDEAVPFSEKVTERRRRWASFDARDLGNEMQHIKLGDPDPSSVTRAKTSEYLILEDLGWERSFHMETLLDIVAPRYKKSLPTIVTSGERMEALREKYGDAVHRRFWDIDGKPGVKLDLWKS